MPKFKIRGRRVSHPLDMIKSQLKHTITIKAVPEIFVASQRLADVMTVPKTLSPQGVFATSWHLSVTTAPKGGAIMRIARSLAVLFTTFAVIAMSVAGVVATTAVGAPSSSPQPTPTLSMTAIDVGRGDALLVTYPNGQHMLVDGGTAYAARTYVIPYLIQHKITHLDAIVCTHENGDHLDGLTELFEDGRFTVGTAYDTNFPLTKNLQQANQDDRHVVDEYLTLLANKRVRHVVVKAGDELSIGRNFFNTQKNAVTRVVSPNAGLTQRLSQLVTDGSDDTNHAAINENSVVLRVQYNNVSYLLTGDTGDLGPNYADWSMMQDVQESQYLHADVLKLGHHGFEKPDNEFYSQVRPSYVVMSYGPYMNTANPGCEGLRGGAQNFGYFKTQFSLDILNTCSKGTITVSTDGTKGGIHVQTEPSGVPKVCCCNCAASSTYPKSNALAEEEIA